MGRGGSTPSRRSAMALASKTPIQIGRKSWLWVSRRMTMGTLDEGASISPLISTRSSLVGLLMSVFLARRGSRSRRGTSVGAQHAAPLHHGETSLEAVREGGFDFDPGHTAQKRGLGAGGEVDHAVAGGTAGLRSRLPGPAGHDD